MSFSFLAIANLIFVLAAAVILFWLAITAIRALNVYIRKNRLPSGERQ